MEPVVLGAGVAGLAAGVALAHAGLAPHVIESRPFVGGRVRSFTHSASGDEIDNGQHLLMGCYRETLRLLDLIGTRHLVSIQPRLHVEFRDADGTADHLIAPPLPPPFDVLAGLLRMRGLSLSERYGLLRVAREARRGGARSTGETVNEMLVRLGQSKRACDRLWNPIVIATLNTSPSEASAELFIEVMRRAFLGSGDDSRLVLPRAGLSSLFEPAVAFIRARGGIVELGRTATHVERELSRFRVHVSDGSTISCDRIVSALPSRQASAVLGNLLPPSVLPEIAMSPIVSIYLWYDRPLASVPEMTALIGTSVQWVFNRRRMMGDSEQPGLLSCTISAADVEAASAADAVIAVADAELRRAFAEIADARIVDAIVLKEKHATFKALPRMMRPEARTSVTGLYLAGDWTSTHLPATIEGAVQSGFDAATMLIGDSVDTTRTS